MIIDLLKLYDNFSIIPLKGKIPILKEWPKFAEEKIAYKDVQHHKDNFGIVCGYDNLEVIDVDNHFQDADKLYEFIEDNCDLSKYLIIKTGGGGYHIYFKCEALEGSQKLAQRLNDKERPEVLVETRGKGGQVVFYNNIICGNILDIPVITAEERNILFQVCRSLNEIEKKTNVTKEAASIAGKRPGEAYNDDLSTINETINLLKSNGWTSKDDKYFKRPNKDTDGISATFGKVGENKFYVFSSNAHPFSEQTSYSMFGVRTELMFNGDYTACAKELAQKYNITLPKEKKPVEPQQKSSKDKWSVLEEIIKDWNLRFRFNIITKVMDVSVDGGDYEALQLLPGDIIREMEVNRGVKSISSNKLMEMVANKSICEVYNPVKSFFKSLPKWDEKDTIKELCKYIKLEQDEQQEFFESMFKKHMIRAIKCAQIPEYINRMVLVFHGSQEIGKSEFFRWLIPKELYNEESINPTEKDSILALSRYILINMDELDSLNKRDVSKLKAFISRGQIIKRVAYGRHDERFNRIASFVGSTNKSDILADITNTRWIILKVDTFDWKGYIKNINPLQIWAQAAEMFGKNKYAGELSKEEKEERERRNSVQFLETTSEREILLKYFQESDKASGMTATDIRYLIETNLHPLKINFYQLVRELHRIYGEAKSTRIEGKGGRYYFLSHSLTSKTENPYTAFNEVVEKDSQESVPF